MNWFDRFSATAEGGSKPSVFYHGTSSVKTLEILSKGLVNPYLCDSPSQARYWADVAAQDNKDASPVIITLPGDRVDESKLRLDHISMDEPIDFAGEEARDDAWDLAAQEHPEWHDKKTDTVSIPSEAWEYSWNSVGAVRYEGAIPVSKDDITFPMATKKAESSDQTEFRFVDNRRLRSDEDAINKVALSMAAMLFGKPELDEAIASTLRDVRKLQMEGRYQGKIGSLIMSNLDRVLDHPLYGVAKGRSPEEREGMKAAAINRLKGLMSSIVATEKSATFGGWYRTARVETNKEPWEMTRQEFVNYHHTGHISSEAYRNYETLEGIAWLGKRSRYPILHSKGMFGGKEIEFRQSGEKLKYTQHVGDEIARDERGMALMMSDEEIRQKGWPAVDTSIVAFDGDTPVGWASDEFGTTGVWVAKPYQRMGIGMHLLKEFSKTFPKRKMGQMTNAGRQLTESYHKRLVEDAIKEDKPVPEKVLADYPDLKALDLKTASTRPTGWFQEITVHIDGLNEKTYMDYDMEVMVHFNEEHEPFLAYTYAKDAKNLDRKYISRKKSLNPLFIYLTQEFIRDNYEEIVNQASDEMRETVLEAP